MNDIPVWQMYGLPAPVGETPAPDMSGSLGNDMSHGEMPEKRQGRIGKAFHSALNEATGGIIGPDGTFSSGSFGGKAMTSQFDNHLNSSSQELVKPVADTVGKPILSSFGSAGQSVMDFLQPKKQQSQWPTPEQLNNFTY